jgi:hypothetical protein
MLRDGGEDVSLGGGQKPCTRLLKGQGQFNQLLSDLWNFEQIGKLVDDKKPLRSKTGSRHP